MSNFLLVYNTCGISNKENCDWYIQGLQSLLDQNFDNKHIVMSSCLNSQTDRQKIQQHFGSSISYSLIDNKVPVNITFNHTVQQCEEHIGRFDGHIYIDSGVIFDSPNIISEINNLYNNGKYGIVTIPTNSDTGFEHWFGKSFPFDDHFIMPIGKACNAHVNCFDRGVFDAYNQRIWPDIFASCCSESVYSFLAASINKKWIIHKDLCVPHHISVDGGSSGFPNTPLEWDREQRPVWDHVIGTKTMRQIIADPEAWNCGFGYEEVAQVFIHNPQCYENGLCSDPNRLLDFIKNNLFVSENIYKELKYTFIHNNKNTEV